MFSLGCFLNHPILPILHHHPLMLGLQVTVYVTLVKTHVFIRPFIGRWSISPIWKKITIEGPKVVTNHLPPQMELRPEISTSPGIWCSPKVSERIVCGAVLSTPMRCNGSFRTQKNQLAAGGNCDSSNGRVCVKVVSTQHLFFWFFAPKKLGKCIHFLKDSFFLNGLKPPCSSYNCRSRCWDVGGHGWGS